MTKSKEVSTITKAAGLAGKTIARMEARAEEVLAEATKQRSLQLVSSGEQFTALIRHGKTTFQFEGESFAVTHND